MKPLEGLKVLELARILAGPWVGQLLADLGADVVKVERPGAGDDTRGWGPPFVEAEDGGDLSAAYFHSCNRGKRSIAADFETPEGQELVRKLAAHADVVIENARVGGFARLGFDDAALQAINPDLVHLAISGFGPDGPDADKPGYDFVAQAVAGLMSITGQPDTEGGHPVKVGVAISDVATGTSALTTANVQASTTSTVRIAADPRSRITNLPARGRSAALAAVLTGRNGAGTSLGPWL